MKSDDLVAAENRDETYKCPETVPESQTGTTAEEKEWELKKEPRPPVPRIVFIVIALLLFVAFLGGGAWYYHTSILPEKYYQRATALYKEGNFKEAAEYYEKVLRIKHERKDTCYYLGVCMERLGRPKDALAYYKMHLTKQSGDAGALMRAGALLSRERHYEEGLAMIERAVKKMPKNQEVWETLQTAAKENGDSASVARAASALSMLYEDTGKIYESAKTLMGLGSWHDALKAYERLQSIASDDMRGIHGANAAKAMLGYPTDPAFTIVPNVSVGPVKIGASKDEVKEVMGRPDRKEFKYVANVAAEIWSFGSHNRKRSMNVLFTGGKVREIETRSAAYKTEKGLGLSNFLLSKNDGEVKKKTSEDGRLIVTPIKGGGLTFYAAGLSDDERVAKYAKLRVHEGSRSMDEKAGFSLTKIFSY